MSRTRSAVRACNVLTFQSSFTDSTSTQRHCVSCATNLLALHFEICLQCIVVVRINGGSLLYHRTMSTDAEKNALGYPKLEVSVGMSDIEISQQIVRDVGLLPVAEVAKQYVCNLIL